MRRYPIPFALALALAAVLFGPSVLAEPEPEASQKIRMVPQIGHAQHLRNVVFTPDGRRIVTAAGDQRAKIWTADGRLIRSLQIGMHRTIAVSPDGKFLAVATMRGRVELWRLDGTYLGAFPAMGWSLVGAVAFTPDSRTMFACTTSSRNDHCREYPLYGKPGIRIDDPFGTNNVQSIGFSPDASIVYLAGGDQIHRYRRDGTPLEPLSVTDSSLWAMAVSPDGTRIATMDNAVSRDGSVPKTRLWTADGELVAEFAGHVVSSLAFTADSEWLIAGSRDLNRVLRVHRSGSPERSFAVGTTRDDTPAAVGVSPDGATIVTSGPAIDPVEIRRWSADGEPLGSFRQANNGVMAMAFDSRAGLIVTASLDDTIRYWSIDGRLVRSHPAGYSKPSVLAIAPNGRAFVSGGTELTLWDDRANAVVTFPVHRKATRALRFSADGHYLITVGIDGYVTMNAIAADAESRRFVAHDGKDVELLAVHPDGRRFATASSTEHFRVWDVDGTRLAEFSMPEGTKPPFSAFRALEFTPDGAEIVSLSRRRDAEIRVHALDGTVLRSSGYPKRSTYQNETMTVSPDGRFVAASLNRSIVLWDLATLEIVRTLDGHESWIAELVFSDDGSHLVSADNEGVLRVWNVGTGASYAMLAEGDEWAVWSDDGYFDASRHGGDLVAMVAGDRAYGVDQFAAIYNRPDRIYEAVGLASPDVIAHFRSYHGRRAAALGGRAGTGQAPRLRVVDSRQDGETLRLALETAAPGAAESFLQVHANGVPLYESPGRAIAAGPGPLEIDVPLAGGRNKIEVGVVTGSGVRSLRVPIFVDRPPANGALYYVGLGVSQYADAELNLQFAAKDVNDLGEALASIGDEFDAVHRLEITDEQVTRDGLGRVREFLDDAEVNDTVVLLVSGHGAYVLDDVPTYYFVPHDANGKNLSRRGITFDEIEALISRTPARRRLLFLDTCQSGEYDEATIGAAAELAAEQGLSIRARASLLAEKGDERPPYVYRRDRYIYNDVSRRTGAVVFSSSLASEASLESAQLENGVFTHAVIRALRDRATDSGGDGAISVSELETAVKRWVVAATGGLQHPTIERENIDQTIVFPLGRAAGTGVAD